LFDPYSVLEMSRAIADVLLDGEMRVRLERLGSNRAASFTWERAAQRTLDVYYEVAGVSKPVTAMKVRASSST
jgi:glycosyltransferase involved in cell wall biosynthesis